MSESQSQSSQESNMACACSCAGGTNSSNGVKAANSAFAAPASASVPSSVSQEFKDRFVTVAAQPRIPLPDAASANLVWKGSGASAGETISYRATAGHIDVRSNSGALMGNMFSMSYISLDEQGLPQKNRPVTFAFNGGPGCASVPINFGGIGPRRVKPDGVKHLRFPIEVEDNPSTLLRETDLVFLDALGTGWSTLADGVDHHAIFGIDGDADAFCRAIISWLEEHGRWMSPVYLFGESYGTTRNAVLMRLLGEKDVKVAGVTMLSAIFDFSQVEEGSDLYHLGMLPTMAATAQFFGKAGVGIDVDTWFDRALNWTDHVLAPALLLGDRLSANEEEKVAQEMSAFIGLPEAHIRACHLRITLDDFRRHLLYEEGRVIGRLDMRYSSDAPVAVQDSSSWFASQDAADDAVEPSWTSAFRDFCHNTLGYSYQAPYMSMNYDPVGINWNWKHTIPGKDGASMAPNVAYDIAVSMRRNPAMKLCIIGGRYDAATTYWNVLHDISCQFLSEELKERVEWHRYGCGHMAYTDDPTLVQMSADMEAFYQKA